MLSVQQSVMLKDFQPRLYQETILSTAANKNTLVVLPTGMGKTAIALLLAAHRFTQYPQSKMVFLAPTKPLAEQHLRTFKEHLAIPEEQMIVLTGETSPKERPELWRNARCIFCTPQGLENDVVANTIDLSQVSLLAIDEAHRATGEYSYVFIAKQYNKKASYPRILALTASPGSELEHIEEVCHNLFIDAVEIRTEEDPDVKPYVQEVDVDFIKVQLSLELKEIQKLFQQCVSQRLQQLRQLGAKGNLLSKKDILSLQAELHKRFSEERDTSLLKGISVAAETLKVQHALELLESQGVSQLRIYLQKLEEEAASGKTKAAKQIVQDLNFKTALVKISHLAGEHPKLAEVRRSVKEETEKNRMTKIILFTQFRDSATRLFQELSSIEGVVPVIFVGQQKKGTTGLSQKKQVEILDQFRDGLYNVLIATSVAEEGLDIPQVDLVLFYEPVPSAIRTIQRRGRTGRLEKGKVAVLITQGTRDEAFHYTAKNREKQMVRHLQDLRTSLNIKLKPRQAGLADYSEPGITIFADYREKGTGVVKKLADIGVQMKLDMLQVGDYVLSSRVGVEYKTSEDFVGSIIDGRLLQQVKELRNAYERPLIIIEGGDVYRQRNIHPNAIRGMLATISVNFAIPVMYTKDADDTAQMLMAIAKREQDETTRDFSPHASRKPLTLKEQQEYLVQALPSIGPQLAKTLLEHFKTAKAVFNASKEELMTVEGLGEKKAEGILKVTQAVYS